RLVAVVDEEQVAAPPDQLQRVGQAARAVHPGVVEHAGQQLAQPGDGGGGQVPGGAGAEVVAGEGGVPGVRPGGEGVLGDGSGGQDPLGPDPAVVPAGDGDGLVLAQRVELLDRQAQHLAERARVGAGVYGVVLVDDAGEVRDEQVAAALHVPVQVLGRGLGQQVHAGRDHQPVARQVGGGVDEVDG